MPAALKTTQARPNRLSLLRWCRQLVLIFLIAIILINLYDTIEVASLKNDSLTDLRYQKVRILREEAQAYPHTWLGKTPLSWLDDKITLIQQWQASSFAESFKTQRMEKHLAHDWEAAEEAGDHGSHNGLFPKAQIDESAHPLLSLFWINLYSGLLKLTLLAAALPWFGLSFVMGLTDGLVQRAIRKYELGRESTFLFHKLGGWLLNISSMVWFAYLLAGDEIHPLLYFIPMAALVGLFMYYSSSRFKKYL
jgi:integrating conjugative element membrane protein (TIGR03747 family)